MNLDPNVRKKLLKEAKSPFLGVRRLLWGALLASAGVGLIIMILRSLTGVSVPLSDIGVQLFALLLFGVLIYVDRNRAS